MAQDLGLLPTTPVSGAAPAQPAAALMALVPQQQPAAPHQQQQQQLPALQVVMQPAGAQLGPELLAAPDANGTLPFQAVAAHQAAVHLQAQQQQAQQQLLEQQQQQAQQQAQVHAQQLAAQQAQQAQAQQQLQAQQNAQQQAAAQAAAQQAAQQPAVTAQLQEQLAHLQNAQVAQAVAQHQAAAAVQEQLAIHAHAQQQQQSAAAAAAVVQGQIAAIQAVQPAPQVTLQVATKAEDGGTTMHQLVQVAVMPAAASAMLQPSSASLQYQAPQAVLVAQPPGFDCSGVRSSGGGNECGELSTGMACQSRTTPPVRPWRVGAHVFSRSGESQPPRGHARLRLSTCLLPASPCPQADDFGALPATTLTPNVGGLDVPLGIEALLPQSQPLALLGDSVHEAAALEPSECLRGGKEFHVPVPETGGVHPILP